MAGEAPYTLPARLISVAEASRRLGVSESTGYRLANAGALPGLVRLPGTHMRVRARVLEAWLDGAEGDAGVLRHDDGHAAEDNDPRSSRRR